MNTNFKYLLGLNLYLYDMNLWPVQSINLATLRALLCGILNTVWYIYSKRVVLCSSIYSLSFDIRPNIAQYRLIAPATHECNNWRLIGDNHPSCDDIHVWLHAWQRLSTQSACHRSSPKEWMNEADVINEWYWIINCINTCYYNSWCLQSWRYITVFDSLASRMFRVLLLSSQFIVPCWIVMTLYTYYRFISPNGLP